MSKVALLVKSKVALAVLGVLVAGTGGTAALAATGHMPTLPNLPGTAQASDSHGDNGNHGHTVSIEGTLKAYNVGAKTISVQAVNASAATSVAVNAQTRVTGEHASHLSDLADAVGHKVQVQATKQSDGSLVAWKITVEGAASGGSDNSHGNNTQREIAGTISSVNANGFVVKTATGESVTIVGDAHTSVRGSVSALAKIAVGMRVEVRGTVQANGSVLAETVQVESGGSGGSGDHGSGQ